MQMVIRGKYKTVTTEVTVVINFAKITAVEVFRTSKFIFTLVKTMIKPFPNKSTHKAVVVVNNIPIIFKVTGAVAHGMTIFT